MPRTRSAHLPALLLALSVLLAPVSAQAQTPPSPPGSQVGSIGAVPDTSDPRDPRTRAYFVRAVAPGASFTDAVRVTNNSPERVRLLVSAVDGVTAEGTGSVFTEHGSAPTRAGAWVTPAVGEVELEPGGVTRVAFTVRVPTGVRPGDHLGGVSVLNTSTTSKTSGVLTVETQVRSVVGVLVQVPGATRAALAISDASIGTIPGVGTPAVRVQVSAPGQRLVRPRILVRLRSGSYERTVERDLDTILPENSISLAQPWPEAVPAGRHSLHVEASAPGMSTVVWDSEEEVSQILTLPTRPPAPGSVTRSAPESAPEAAEGLPGWVVGLLAGLGGLVAALAGVTVWLTRRRRGPGASAPPV